MDDPELSELREQEEQSEPSLEQVVRRAADLEKAGKLFISDVSSTEKNPTSPVEGAVVMNGQEATLFPEQRKLTIIQTDDEGSITRGQDVVSAGFGGCQAALVHSSQHETSLLQMRHNFGTHPENVIKFVRAKLTDAQAVDRKPETIVLLSRSLTTNRSLAENLRKLVADHGLPADIIRIGDVDYKQYGLKPQDTYCVWAQLNSKGDLEVRVTTDDLDKKILPVSLKTLDEFDQPN